MTKRGLMNYKNRAQPGVVKAVRLANVVHPWMLNKQERQSKKTKLLETMAAKAKP